MIQAALSRRRMLGFLGVGALGATVAAPAHAGERHDILLTRTHIAGWRYYEAPRLRQRLVPGQALRLQRDPDNPHDALAIVVEAASGDQLGYLPRQANQLPCTMMDLGYELRAVFAGDEGHDHWDCLAIEVVASLPPPG